MSSPEAFAAEFNYRKEAIDANVAAFADELSYEAEQHDGLTRTAISSYNDLLVGPGKRFRGVLTQSGYCLVDGEDATMIARAGAVMEVIHAHLLVFDDVADNSDVRRGDSTAHIAMRNALASLGLDLVASTKAGIDMAELGALVAQDMARATLLELPVAEDRKNLASRILGRRLVQTGFGQLRDLASQYLPTSAEDALTTAKLKTGLYTFVLPTQVGAALGGAPANELGKLEPFGVNAGVAFQLRDDILGLVGKPEETGKPLNDIAEGKRTFIVLTAMERASQPRRNFLHHALGDRALRESDYEECLDIIRSTDALDTAHQLIESHTSIAIDALDNLPDRWNQQEIEFLRGVALLSLRRKS